MIDVMQQAVTRDDIRHDLVDGFTIVARHHEWFVDFKVYRIEKIDEHQGPCWAHAASPFKPSHPATHHLHEAATFLRGTIHRCGKSQWRFDAQDHDMIRISGKAGLDSIGALMSACWGIAQNHDAKDPL